MAQQSNQEGLGVSDFNPFVGDSGPEAADPGGVPVVEGQANDPVPAEEPRAYLELDDDVANRYVRVRVDGEDVEVPLREALNGYSRTADYTRKTQDLAQQRQQAEYALALQQALQAHPAEAIGLLARQYGVDLGQSQPQQAAPSYDDGLDDDPYMDPMERRLAQIERQNQALQAQWQQRQADEELRQAIVGLKTRYQLDDNAARQVVGTALQMGLGPQSFDMIYKNIAFDRAVAARQAAQQQRAAVGQQRQDARANAAALIGSEPSLNGGGAPQPVLSDGPMTIAQAFDAALLEQGVSF